MKFSRYFNIEIRHEYYDNGLCSDLHVIPTASCAALLSKCRMMFNADPSNPGVIAELNDAGQLLRYPPADAQFEFYLLVSNQSFFTYTSPLPLHAAEAFQFSNRDSGSIPSLSLLSSSVPKEQSVIDGKPVFGFVRIVPDATFPLTYVLSFKAAKLKWKYYLIAGSSLANLSIDGTASDIRFIKTSSTSNPQGDEIYDALISNYPGAGLTIFESENEVSLRQVGRKNIQLINTSNNVILVPNLPNPSLGANGIRIVNTLS